MAKTDRVIKQKGPGYERKGQLDSMVERLRKMENGRIRVGFLKDAAPYPDTGISVVAVAVWNEFGTVFSPPRPFFRTALKLSVYKKEFQKLALDVIHGRTTVEDGLGRLGMRAVADIQKNITAGKWTANDPSTIVAKGSSKPLIDSGFMRKSVTYVIEGF